MHEDTVGPKAYLSPVESSSSPSSLTAPSLFSEAALESPADLALALAPPAAAGHFDELRGGSALAPGLEPGLAPPWQDFVEHLGSEGFADLNRRNANLQRLIRDNGVSYNVYADADGPQRPWALDLFPMLIQPEDWAGIEAGVKQRADLLERIMADVYGPQTLPRQGLLPTALVQGHPGYLRAMHGVQPAGGHFLHVAAFDLARGPDSRWWVVSQRTQAPSGLGYLLENRISISLQFPEAFRAMKVQRVAAAYRALVDGMKAACARLSDEPRIVLLTPGPYNETYFEHAYLARYLGLALVEGSDLMVRGDQLYLKTLQGLQPVHGLLKRLDDEFLDPLELRSDSTLGVPGLLQAIRAGNVVVANAPGSAFLESAALLGFLPALSEHVLGEPLALPSLATWWCGEQAAAQSVLPQLKNCVIKPTYPASGLESVIGLGLSRDKLDEWAGRIMRNGGDYTVQAYLPLSQTPTWQSEKLAPRSAMLRVFAVRNSQGEWQVLPGGLARLAGKNENIASMQHGGSSADVWLPSATSAPSISPAQQAQSQSPSSQSQQSQSQGPTQTQTQAPSQAPPIASSGPSAAFPPANTGLTRQQRAVTSRAAENLFWLGRYTERAENSVRLARLTLQALSGEDQSSEPLLNWLSAMAVNNALVLPDVPGATQARRVFERSLIANLGDTRHAASVGFNLRALKQAASAVRERLSQEQWQTIVRAEQAFFQHCGRFSGAANASLAVSTGQPKASQGADYSALEALRALDGASNFLAAMTGAQTDRMMRDDGWRLLSIGRHIERLNTLASALVLGFDSGAANDEAGFNAIVALFDSTITFHAQYQQRRELPALMDLLVLDRDNPRSLAWVLHTLQGRLAKLEGLPQGEPSALASDLPDPRDWALTEPRQVREQLSAAAEAALALSNRISQRYFSHAASSSQSLGA